MSLLSLIVPIYNESDSISAFFNEVKLSLEDIKKIDWEIICVDDGSNDDSFEKLTNLGKEDPRIRAIRLSRNFGKEIALTAGLDYASGDCIIPIDADLQDPPEIIPEMIEKWREGYDVVLATRATRDQDSLPKKLGAKLFYRTIKKISNTEIPQDTGDFRLMSRKVVEVIQKFPERTRFMKGLFAWVGFKQCQIFYDRPARASGKTAWNFKSLINFAMDGIISFSSLPLKIWTYIGLIISGFSFAYAIYLILKTIILGVDVPGYASIMVTILFIGGIQLISLGVIGEYIARIYREVKHRPLYVVAEVNNLDKVLQPER